MYKGDSRDVAFDAKTFENIFSRVELSEEELEKLLADAVDSGRLQTLQFLISQNVKLSNAESAWWGASQLWQRFLGDTFEEALEAKSDSSIFEWLIEHGLDLQKMPLCEKLRQYDYSPSLLHYAVIKGAVNAIAVLVKRGFNVNAKTANGYAPIHFAKSIPMILALVAMGADVNARSHAGYTVINLFLRQPFYRSDFENLSVLIHLEQFNAEVTDKRGNNYFHWLMTQDWVTNSISRGHIRVGPGYEEICKKHLGVVVELLKVHGVNINARNCYGATPLDLAPNAFARGCLIQAGADSAEVSNSQSSSSEQKFQLEHDIGYQPSQEDFVFSVKQFKNSCQLKSVKMLHDRTNQKRGAFRIAFFTNPVIRSYITRDVVEVHDRVPVIHKYEQHFYESGVSGDGNEIPYRCDWTHKEDDECFIPKKNKFSAAFLHKGTTDLARSMLVKKLDERAESVASQDVLLLKPSDFYGISEKLDELVDVFHAESGFLFIVMPVTKDGHASTYAAIFDRKNNDILAVFDCNSLRVESTSRHCLSGINLNRKVEKHFLVIDARHHLQKENTDVNCALYTHNFCLALMKAFSENEVLRSTLTSYSKEVLQADEALRNSLGQILLQAMMPYLEQYYEMATDGSYVERSYEAISYYHCQLRWRIGNESIRNDIATTESVPSENTEVSIGI